MEILEAFDLTKSYRDAAELANCSPSTVARYVEARSQGLLGVLSVLKHPVPEEGHMKFDEEIMEILEAFDLTKSYRDAAELANCSPSTVARYVEARAEGRLSSAPVRRDQI